MTLPRSTLLWVALGVVGILMVYGIVRLIPGKYFERGKLYVTYFDESVQGLQEDSRVHYRGADVGRVMDVRVAPDQKLIAVTLKLKLKEDVTKEGVTQLKVNPISGQVYLELDRRKPEEEVRMFKLDFKPPYPVIPSRYSDIQKAMGGVNILVEKLEEADTKGIFDQVKSTVKQVEVFFRGPRMEAILEKVEGTVGNLQSITGRVDKVLALGKVEDILKEAENTLKGAQNVMGEAQTLMARVDGEIKDLNIREIIGRARSLTLEVKATNDNLKSATENLDALVNRIYQRPPDALFGKPGPGRFNE